MKALASAEHPYLWWSIFAAKIRAQQIQMKRQRERMLVTQDNLKLLRIRLEEQRRKR